MVFFVTLMLKKALIRVTATSNTLPIVLQPIGNGEADPCSSKSGRNRAGTSVEAAAGAETAAAAAAPTAAAAGSCGGSCGRGRSGRTNGSRAGG